MQSGNLNNAATYVAKGSAYGGVARALKESLGSKKYLALESPETDYQLWIRANENWNELEIKEDIKRLGYKPKFSIIVPVFNVSPQWLDRCIESVTNQYYDKWELCLYDDASTDAKTIECLRKWEKKADPRIRIAFGEINQHISGASNEALKMATGEFIALMDNDDELAPIALYENAKLLNEHPEADMIYSDEDKLTPEGIRVAPFFKPDWSPDLFLSGMYICHLIVYRKSIIDKIGGFRKGYEGSQDYDIALRFIENTEPENIFHIPKILYHWRMIESSTAFNPNTKSYAFVAAKKAISDYLERNGIEGEVIDNGSFLGTYRVRRPILGDPKVSIIIPFNGQVEELKRCINSIKAKTDYKNYEIILANSSNEENTIQYLDEIKDDPLLIVLNLDTSSSYPEIINCASKRSKGEYLLLLNSSTEIITREWLSSMIEQVQREEVGAVGAKILCPDDTVGHAGYVLGIGVAGHAFKGYPGGSGGYFGLLAMTRNCSAVSGVCLMTKKTLFNEVSGLDEENLAGAYSDIDFCLKLRELGYLIAYTPYAKLYQHNLADNVRYSEARFPDEENLEEIEYMLNKWFKYIEQDPYYNPNLTRNKGDFGINVDSIYL